MYDLPDIITGCDKYVSRALFNPVKINARVIFDNEPIITFVKELESLLSEKIISTERWNIEEYKPLKEDNNNG